MYMISIHMSHVLYMYHDNYVPECHLTQQSIFINLSPSFLPLSPSLLSTLSFSLLFLSLFSFFASSILYQQMGQARDSLQAYVTAVFFSPMHVETWTDLGLLYESCDQLMYVQYSVVVIVIVVVNVVVYL